MQTPSDERGYGGGIETKLGEGFGPDIGAKTTTRMRDQWSGSVSVGFPGHNRVDLADQDLAGHGELPNRDQTGGKFSSDGQDLVVGEGPEGRTATSVTVRDRRFGLQHRFGDFEWRNVGDCNDFPVFAGSELNQPGVVLDRMRRADPKPSWYGRFTRVFALATHER